MIVGELKNKVDRIWEMFWTGGVTNPLSVIEQITYLLFIKGLDAADDRRAKEFALLEIPFTSLFPEDQPELHWATFKNYEAARMHDTVVNKVFPFDRLAIQEAVVGDEPSVPREQHLAFVVPVIRSGLPSPASNQRSKRTACWPWSPRISTRSLCMD